MPNQPSSEAWKKMVLRSMPAPAWLERDAPDGDIVISSRIRYARNLRGFRFPHHASNEELREIRSLLRSAADGWQHNAFETLTEAERDFMIGSRLISPEFKHKGVGRVLMLDPSRTVSLMVNEEDHLRLQALTAGWSIKTAQASAEATLRHISQSLRYMQHPQLGFLTASPTNRGVARRRSALFHLIGLAHTKRLPQVIRALGAWGLTARGLYGESSRAVGAFFQVSAVAARLPEFLGACEYLIGEERQARREVTRLELQDRARQAAEFAISSAEIGLADALRVLGWVRWASAVSLPGYPEGHREVDAMISTMEVHGTQDQRTAARHRATFLRERLDSYQGPGPN